MVNEQMLIGGMQEIDDKRVSIKDILDFIFRRDDIEQKTVLTAGNINALIKMRATNKYLRKYYGFEIDLYQTIIDEKRLNIISLKGRGRDDILESVRAMQNQVIQEEKKGLI